MPGRSMDVTKVLIEMGIPETIQKRTETATINLVTSPEVLPQTNYMTSGIMAAAVFAGGYLFGKNRAAKGDDTFAAVL